MKNWPMLLFVLVLLALDWAALHDILKGNELNLYSEYTMLAAIAVIFAALAWRWQRSARVRN